MKNELLQMLALRQSIMQSRKQSSLEDNDLADAALYDARSKEISIIRELIYEMPESHKRQVVNYQVLANALDSMGVEPTMDNLEIMRKCYDRFQNDSKDDQHSEECERRPDDVYVIERLLHPDTLKPKASNGSQYIGLTGVFELLEEGSPFIFKYHSKGETNRILSSCVKNIIHIDGKSTLEVETNNTVYIFKKISN